MRTMLVVLLMVGGSAITTTVVAKSSPTQIITAEVIDSDAIKRLKKSNYCRVWRLMTKLHRSRVVNPLCS